MRTRKSQMVAIPQGWRRQVRTSVLRVISLAQFALVYTRVWAANSPSAHVRAKAHIDRLTQELNMMQEEIRIKDTRWPRKSTCAKPQTLVAGQPGDKFTVNIDYYQGRRHLPVVKLKRAA